MRVALPAVFLLAIANGLFVDISYALSAPIWRLPFSPVIVIIVVAAARLLISTAPLNLPFFWIATGFLTAGALVPSSLASWLMLSAISAAGIHFDRARLAGYHMTLALALTQIWHSSALKVFAGTLTGGEAVLLAICLRLMGFSPEVDGNIVRVTSEHALVLLSGCSVFSGLGIVLLGWSAAFCLLRPGDRFRAHYVPVVALAAISLNLIRLILMALGPDWHTFVHDGMGAQIYDASLCLLVISAGWIPQSQSGANRPTQAAAPPRQLPVTAVQPLLRRFARPEAFVAVALLAVLFASLALKSVRYASIDTTGWQDAKAQIKGAIQKHGFEFAGTIAITSDNAIEGMVFRKPNCSAPLVVGMMGASSDTLPMISQYLAGTPVEVYLDEQPVRSWAVSRFLSINIVEIAASLSRGRKPLLHPLIAVSRPKSGEPSDCNWPPLT